jgi:hypothetical protein
MDNSTKLIEKIKEEQVKPIPKWQFTFKDTFIWLAFIICVLFGALAFSVILFAIQQSDFDLFSHMSHSFLELLLGLVPVIWLLALLLFLVIAILSIKNSKKGYKFTTPAMFGFATALSILLGTLFFITGGAERLENAFASNISSYEGIEERKSQVWSRPADGFLSGTIISVEDTAFELRDFSGKTWKINFNGADIVPAVTISDGEKIKLAGKITNGNSFKAEIIRPWGGLQRRYHGGRGNN